MEWPWGQWGEAWEAEALSLTPSSPQLIFSCAHMLGVAFMPSCCLLPITSLLKLEIRDSFLYCSLSFAHLLSLHIHSRSKPVSSLHPSCHP